MRLSRTEQAMKELERIRLESLTPSPWSFDPELLMSLRTNDKAMRLIFGGLQDHYFEAVTSGRLDKWAAAAHAAIELFACVPEARIVKRSEMRGDSDI
jgi:hypothetical protein